ncbi:major capsid protein [Phocoenobacter skyensis]|uniref:Uncharacterized conserved protein YjdB, contains Ig-like domain n=1 Tax=Phocoenobacter skyensis TaxID=97481 RepID=A0A1H8A6F2_9PAST|nr:major capsid protein [Pasteurella skyensis]QLB23327.1 phage capsid protein [Pasteurella skyensis]SEM65408.1 Uncharacterized conserved protein YjdB, contains Ig-like domain [Pasteurella skyensis]
MATTVNSDVIIYNQDVQTGYLEQMQDNLATFNKASNGALVLEDKNILGDFSHDAFYKIGGSIKHRDVNSNAAAEGNKIDMGEKVGVKVPFMYGPYEMTKEAMKRRGRSPEEFSQVVGRDYADALIEGYFNYATASLDGAIGSNSQMQTSGSISVDGKKVMTKGFRAFGDKFNRVGLWLMDSETWFDFIDQAIAEKIYEEAGVVIYGGMPGTLNVPVLVTDQAKQRTIYGLQPGAVKITNSQLPEVAAYNINDRTNLSIGVRAEGTFNIDVLGYSYNDKEAGSNPDIETLGATASWKKYASSNKNTAGVIITLT